MRRHKTFFACGSCAPVRAEHEGGAAAWLAGTLVGLQTKLARKRSVPQRVGRRDGTCPWASSWSSWSSGPHTGLDFAWGSANQNTENGSAHFSPEDAPHWGPAEMNP